MAVEHGIWKVGDTPQLLCNSIIDSEKLLEDQIRKDISILNENWMLIGQQVYTDFNKYIDLLAVDAEGKVIIIELKKDKTLIYAELSGDFPLGDSRQPTYKSLRPFDLVS